MDAISKALDAIRREMPGLGCRTDEPMSEHTSFEIGGRVRAMYFPSSADELALLHDALRSFEIRTLILGNGTNMLVNDGNLDIAAIKMTGLDKMEISGAEEITAEAGAPLSRLAGFALENGLSGLEFAYGIPGSLGGAVSMNAGAYGSEMKDVVVRTTAFSPGSGVFAATGEEHGFSYRRSRFTDTRDIALSSVIKLRRGDETGIRAKMDELISNRRESQPWDKPSAGSTFKRPGRGYAAALIEQAGLKGFAVGGAQVSPKHAGFVINRGGATFDDVMMLIDCIIEKVFTLTGIELEPEVRVIR